MSEGTEVNVSNVLGVISNSVPTVDDGVDRNVAVYRSVFATTAKIAGVEEHSAKSNIFNVNCTSKESGINLETNLRIGARVSTAVRVQEMVRAEIKADAATANSLSGGWEFVEMSGVVAILASALAYYRFHKELTQEIISAGKVWTAESARASVRPITPNDKCVYLSEHSDRQTTPNIIAALGPAVTGAGSTLWCKDIGVNPEDNSKILPTASGKTLAVGCLDALNLLARNYVAHGAGDVFAFAFIVGLHRVGTVEGHTDEGGFMRELLRRVQFPAPYGGLSQCASDFSGLPDPTRGTSGFEKLVDSLLLQSAGLVADCDPLVEKGGDLFPTTVVSDYEWSEHQKRVYSALDQAAKNRHHGVAEDALDLVKKLGPSFTAFSATYTAYLGKIFGVAGQSRVAQIALQAEFQHSQGTVYRHLRMKAANPYYWIEPTGVVLVDTSQLPAVREHYGTLCRPNHPGKMPGFVGLSTPVEAAHYAAYESEFVAARKHGLLHHLTMNKEDGLAHIIPRRVVSGKLTGLGVGAAGRRNERLAQKIDNERGMDEYLWGRGHSSVIAPGELLVTNSRIGFLVERYANDPHDRRRLVVNHAPSDEEMRQDVVLSVQPLACLGWMDKGTEGVSRTVERDRANTALCACRDKSMPYYSPALIMPKGVVEDGDLETKSDFKILRGVRSAPEDTGVASGGVTSGKLARPQGVEGATQLPKILLGRKTTPGVRSGPATSATSTAADRSGTQDGDTPDRTHIGGSAGVPEAT